jgi:hypothetical protein
MYLRRTEKTNWNELLPKNCLYVFSLHFGNLIFGDIRTYELKMACEEFSYTSYFLRGDYKCCLHMQYEQLSTFKAIFKKSFTGNSFRSMLGRQTKNIIRMYIFRTVATHYINIKYGTN